MADIDENVVVEETIDNDDRPEIIIQIPVSDENDIDISEWCSNTKRILGKKYKVIFVDPEEG